MRALLLVGVLGGALLVPAVAQAQTARSSVDVEAADKLYAAAKAAMDRGDLKAACPEFAQSQQLDPAAGTLLNLGECEERSGKLATALGHFEAGRAALPTGDYRIAFADQKIAHLTRRVPRLAVNWRGSAEARVERDGIDVAPATFGIALPVEPGEHQVVATLNGQIVARASVTVQEGQVKSAELEPGGAAEPVHAGSPQRTVGLFVLGAGGLSFGVGVVLGVVAKLTYDSASSAANCPSGTASCNPTGVSEGQSAHSQAAVATGAIAVGAGLAVGGLAVYLLAPKGAPVSVAPTVGANGGGLSLRGAW